MKLLVLPRYDRSGASSRQRLLQFVPDLARLGWEITVRPLHRPAYLAALYAGRRRSPLAVAADYARRLGVLRDAGRHDLIWVERELLPWLPWGLERRCTPRRPLVVDYDDAVFHRYDHHGLAIVRRLLGDKIDRVMRQASLVVAGNDYLAERARSVGAGRIAVVPTVIDPALYPAPGPGAPAARPFVIGWIGTPATVGYLRMVGPALATLAAESPVRLVTIGASIDLPGVPGEARPGRNRPRPPSLPAATSASCRCPMARGSAASAATSWFSTWLRACRWWRRRSAPIEGSSTPG